jgi:hypothetical protein
MSNWVLTESYLKLILFSGVFHQNERLIIGNNSILVNSTQLNKEHSNNTRAKLAPQQLYVT